MHWMLFRTHQQYAFGASSLAPKAHRFCTAQSRRTPDWNSIRTSSSHFHRCYGEGSARANLKTFCFIPVSFIGAAAGCVAALCIACISPALAEIQTVSPSTATELAKPLKAQEVKKEKVWLVFLLGAAALFGTTVALENNERLFPAISRANRAMAMSRQQQKEQEAVEQRYLDELESSRRLTSAVEEGLRDAAAGAGHTPAALPPTNGSAAASTTPSGQAEGHADQAAAAGTSATLPPGAAGGTPVSAGTAGMKPSPLSGEQLQEAASEAGIGSDPRPTELAAKGVSDTPRQQT